MKNFWIALSLLLLAIALTVANGFLVRREMQALRALTTDQSALDVRTRFEKAEPFLSLTVNHAILEQAQNAVLEMTVYQNVSHTDYLASRERFLAALDEIEEGEKFNISNIF